MRKAKIERKTKETQVSLLLNLDKGEKYEIDTSLPFFNHLLESFAKHGNFYVKLKAKGDVEVDPHHLVEDVGIVLGEAVKMALGNKVGIARYGNFLMPMDEALSYIVVDISGRSYLDYDVDFKNKKIGTFDLDLIEEFFLAFTRASNITLHISLKKGRSSHHIAESIFKGFGKALKDAVEIKTKKILSTKGKI